MTIREAEEKIVRDNPIPQEFENDSDMHGFIQAIAEHLCYEGNLKEVLKAVHWCGRAAGFFKYTTYEQEKAEYFMHLHDYIAETVANVEITMPKGGKPKYGRLAE